MCVWVCPYKSYVLNSHALTKTNSNQNGLKKLFGNITLFKIKDDVHTHLVKFMGTVPELGGWVFLYA